MTAGGGCWACSWGPLGWRHSPTVPRSAQQDRCPSNLHDSSRLRASTHPAGQGLGQELCQGSRPINRIQIQREGPKDMQGRLCSFLSGLSLISRTQWAKNQSPRLYLLFQPSARGAFLQSWGTPPSSDSQLDHYPWAQPSASDFGQ